MNASGYVLLVDDDEDALSLLSVLLSRNQYEVLTAATAEAAMETVRGRSDEIEVIILDLMMPGKADGYGFCDWLQGHNSITREIPVIVLSAKSSPRDMARSFSAGAFQHITKPYDIHYLLAVLDSMVRLKRIQDSARDTAEKFAAIFENSPLGIMVVNRRYEIVEMNRAMRAKIPGVVPGGGVRILDVLKESVSSEAAAAGFFRAALEDGENIRETLMVELGDGKAWWTISASPLADKRNEIVGAVLIVEDVTREREMEERLLSENSRANAAVERYKEALNLQDEMTDRLLDTQRELREKTKQLEEANDKLEVLSITDELTDLYNRRHFREIFGNEVRRAARYDHPLSVMMMDIDHFKRVNDTHGHLAGDTVLRRIGGILQELLRETDMIARYGGEEFVAVLPETAHDVAGQIAERIRAAVEAEVFFSEEANAEIRCTISIGVVTGSGELSEKNLLDTADNALYKAKEDGRNRVEQTRVGP